LRIVERALGEVCVIGFDRHEDARGAFAEVFRQDLFEALVGSWSFVQDNQSLSRRRGTVRGLHYQAPPHAQGKLVRVLRGRIVDVVVDVRSGSATEGRHAAFELAAADDRHIWVPPGYLHGLQTLEDETVVLYKVTAHYSPGHDGAVRWDDPDLGIAWPLPAAELSAKDRDAPAYAAWRTPFAPAGAGDGF
jgi:dTDP-4-dehydrorhamnose 3,5-epimerase